MIEAHHLTKNFGTRLVLRGINFEAAAGEFVALAGPNGTGKTTFLRILSTLAHPTSGGLKIAGYKLPSQAADVRSLLGFISHLPLLYGDLNAEENLRFYGRMYGISNLQQRVDEVLEQVGLSQRRKDAVRLFSRGMQQRLGVGRAILHKPQVLLLDEPYTGLDVDAGQRLDLILEATLKQGCTIIMTTHDIERAARFAHRLDVMVKGKIIASKPVKDSTPLQTEEFYLQAIESLA